MSFVHLESGFLNQRSINKELKPWLDKVGLDIDPGIPMEELSMAQIQLAVIARNLSMNSRLIIMDEPTSSPTAGGASVGGRELQLKGPADAIAGGMGFIPEDRKLQGLMKSLSVKENMILSRLDELKRKGFLDRSRINKALKELIDSIRIKTPSGESCVDTLSGENQQKVLVAHWLMMEPSILFSWMIRPAAWMLGRRRTFNRSSTTWPPKGRG